MGASKCKECGFNLESLPMQLPASRTQPHGPPTGLALHCPMCGESVPEVLADRGYFWRASEEVYRYWVEGHSPRDEKKDLFSVPIGDAGRFELKFPKPARPLGTLEICHIAVPCFADGDTLQVPTLPVREEYLDCLDEEALRRAREGDRSQGWAFGQLKRVDNKMVYVSEIPYRNFSREHWRKNRPITLVNSGHQVGGVQAFPGVFVRHWPNVNNIRWRLHLVSFGADPDAASLVRDHAWTVRALIPRLGEGGRVELENEPMRVVEVPTVKPGARLSTVSCDGRPDDRKRDNNRPAWISVSVDGRGGGLFAVARATAEEPQAPALVFGLDFGTTNTVLAAAAGDGKVETVKPESGGRSCTRWVFGRGAVDDPLDLWPAALWAGPHRDLLPSELMAARTWGEVATQPAQIDAMKLGVDLGVPLRLWSQGNALPPGAAQRILGDFKWERAVRERHDGAGLATHLPQIQARFLEQAVLTATAWKLANGRAYPSQVAVNYSYPPAFTRGDLDVLKQAAALAGARVADCLGLDWSGQGAKPVEFTLGPDEAQAAILGAQPNRMFTVFVDIGGGSLEVLVEDTLAVEGQFGHAGMQTEVVSNSVYFGGGVYLRSLVRGERTCSYGDYTTLAAQVRNFPNGRALLRAQSLFKPNRVDVARKRAAVYGQAVADYVARLLAGVCLEHGYQHGGGAGAGRALNLSRNRLFLHHNGRWQLGEDHAGGRRVLFTLMLLGNGWNTVEVALREGMGMTLEDHFGTLVRQRLQQILRAEGALAARIGDGGVTLADLEFHVECPSIVGTGEGKVLHRKAAVASSLVTPKKTSSDTKDHRRGVVGLEVNVNGRVVPWHRAWGAAQRLAPGDHPKRKAPPPPLPVVTSTPPATASTPPATVLVGGVVAPPPRLQWYLGDADPPSGPFTLPQLVERALAGRDPAAAARVEVWRQGLDWTALERVPEAMAELAKRAAAELTGPPPRPVWFVADAAGEAGPLAPGDAIDRAVRAAGGDLAAAGGVEVWREGMPGWARLDAVPELESALARRRSPAGPPVRPPVRSPPRAAAPPPRAPAPPPRALPKEWYIDDGQGESGPWTAAEAAERACAGRSAGAALTVMAWRDGMSEWTAIDAVPALRDAVTARRP